MKGLIIKDYYCMKKTMKLIVLVSLATIFLAVLFSLSARYGNVAKSIAYTASELKDNNKIPQEQFYFIYRYVIWIVLFIPMAFIGNILDCFSEDKRADFAKYLFSYPVKSTEMVGARYISCMIYALVGMIASTIAAIGVSMASDQLRLEELLHIICTFAGVMIIFVAIAMPFVYGLGADKKDVIQVGAFIVLVIIMGLKVKTMANNYSSKLAYIKDSSARGNKVFIAILKDINQFLSTKGIWVLLVAIIIYTTSYAVSVAIINKKRGDAVC